MSDTNDEMWAHTLHVEHELGECRKRLAEAQAALRDFSLSIEKGVPGVYALLVKGHAAALKAAREAG
jgi:hypothetical protein